MIFGLGNMDILYSDGVMETHDDWPSTYMCSFVKLIIKPRNVYNSLRWLMSELYRKRHGGVFVNNCEHLLFGLIGALSCRLGNFEIIDIVE